MPSHCHKETMISYLAKTDKYIYDIYSSGSVQCGFGGHIQVF